jgi:hypothetical protein
MRLVLNALVMQPNRFGSFCNVSLLVVRFKLHERVCSQGEPYDGEVMNALHTSHTTILGFMNPPSLTDFVRLVGSLDETKLKYLDMVSKNMRQIRDWFDNNVSHTYGEIIGKLNAIMGGGHGCLRLTPSGVRLEIEFKSSSRVDGVNPKITEDQLEVTFRTACLLLSHCA